MTNLKWLIGVDGSGKVFVIEKPKVLKEYGLPPKDFDTEGLGLPYDVDWQPGIYAITTNMEWCGSSYDADNEWIEQTITSKNILRIDREIPPHTRAGGR